MVDHARLENAIRELLLAIGEDPDRAELRGTPRKTAQGYAELFDGVGVDAASVLTTFRDSTATGLVMVKDIDFFSVCEHNLVPSRGVAHIGYLPDDGRITGVGTVVRVVEALAHRPQLQERLTTQIADTLVSGLRPRGVIVVLRAEHLCMSVMGVLKPGARIVTSAARGCFEHALPERVEALSLMGMDAL